MVFRRPRSLGKKKLSDRELANYNAGHRVAYGRDERVDPRIILQGAKVRNLANARHVAGGNYPVYCQVLSLGRSQRIAEIRRFDTEADLLRELGRIDSSFTATLRPAVPPR
jgi:hypothetical protein